MLKVKSSLKFKCKLKVHAINQIKSELKLSFNFKNYRKIKKQQFLLNTLLKKKQIENCLIIFLYKIRKISLQTTKQTF